jgi:hypothetical protein
MELHLKPGRVMAATLLQGKQQLRAGRLVASCLMYGTIVIKPGKCFGSILMPESSSVIEVPTERRVAVSCQAKAGVQRTVTSTNILTIDTVRLLGVEPLLECGTKRNVANIESAQAESIRYCQAIVSCRAAAIRTIHSPLQIVSATASRVVSNGCAVSVVTLRETYRWENIIANTARRLPSVIADYAKSGIQSVSISLNERTLSDTFQLVTTKPMEIEDRIRGQLLDFPYEMQVEETSQQELLQTVKGMYSLDRLLYTPINIDASDETASFYAAQIAAALGLSIQCLFDEFTPSQDYSLSGMTYQDLISSLFGWTSRLPQRQINVFLRGKTLYAVQRGREQSVLDITAWPHTRLTVDRKLVRSVWDNSTTDTLGDKARNNKTLEPKPFTGTISAAGCSMEYQDGLLVREDKNGDVTTYAYVDEYLNEKRTHNQDGSTVLTQYEYAKTANDIYLFAERERTTESPKDDKTHDAYDWTDWDGTGTERITYHSPIGYGWYTTSVYVDGEFQGSALSQGKPGGKASTFTIDESNRSLGSDYDPADGDGPEIRGTSLIDTEFPVEGEDFLGELTEAINWLNRKRQEEVTLEVVSKVRNGVSEIQHIVDFTERVRLNGQEYFLVANQVELTPRSLRQKLKLVRWYE